MKAPGKKPRPRPESVDAYLAAVPAKPRAALEKLRRAIRAAAPDATELISYGVPAFRLGRLLVSYAAFDTHLSFFLMSTETPRSHAAALAGYDVGKGTVRFTAEKPLPAALVKTLVRARLAENAALDAKAKRQRAR
jgi:uncharacterized protein YdhG (YjbR/CyaY superfamily)